MGNARNVLDVRMRHWVGAVVAITVLALSPACATDYGTPGSPAATMSIQGDQIPAPSPKFSGKIERNAPIEALLAAAHRAAERRAERAPDHDRRFRLRRPQHIRRRDPDTRARSDCRQRVALHQLQFDRAVLADPRGADHRAQPPFGRIRRHLGTGHRLSGLQQHHHQGQGDDRPDPERQRLPHLVVRQEPQHACVPGKLARPVRPVADRHGLRILLRVHGRRYQPMGADNLARNTTYIYPFVGNPATT